MLLIESFIIYFQCDQKITVKKSEVVVQRFSLKKVF